jgi:hypothetical protein
MKRLKGWLPRLRVLFTGGIAAMLFGAIFYLGIYSERTGFVEEVLDPGLKRITLPVLNALRSELPPVESFALLIEDADLDSMSAIRERAIDRGVLIEGKDSWFPVVIVYQDETLTGKIRLKGGLTDHLQGEKWSYRVKLDSGMRVMDCTRFSIHHPNTRNFVYEWLFHQALSLEDFPAIRYDFVKVDINGKDFGMYGFEEHFDMHWGERDTTILGPTMKFDDERRLMAIAEVPESANDPSLHPLAGWYVAPIKTFQQKRVLDDPIYHSQFTANEELLETFRNGNQKPSEVFDIDALGRFFALCDILGAQHAQDWRNIRFIRSKAMGKLLPVGFDGNAGERIQHIRPLRESDLIDFKPESDDGFYDRLLTDTLFYAAYMKYAETYIQSEWLKDFLFRVEDDLNRKIQSLKSEFPRFEHSLEVFEHCRKAMERDLFPTLLLDIQAGENPRSIRVASLNQLPVEVLFLKHYKDTIPLNRIILPCDLSHPLRYDVLQLDELIGDGQDWALISRTMGTSKKRSISLPSLKTP